MRIRNEFYPTLELSELWRSILKMRDPFRLSRQSDLDISLLPIRVDRFINIIEFDEMNRRESRNQISELFGCDTSSPFLVPVGGRPLPKRNGTRRIDLQQISGTRAETKSALQRNHILTLLGYRRAQNPDDDR